MADQAGSGGDRERLEHVVAEVVSGPLTGTGVKRAVAALARAVRGAGPRRVADGSLAAELVAGVTPLLAVRGAESLRAANPGLTDEEVAARVVRSASVLTAAIGAATGALASGAEATGAGIVGLPVPLVADTVLSALVEIRMVAELHELLDGSPASAAHRWRVVLRAWASGRAVRSASGDDGGGSGHRLPVDVGRMVQRRLARRATRSLVILAPALTGAAAGGELNRRATRSLGQAVVADLSATGVPRRRWRPGGR